MNEEEKFLERILNGDKLTERELSEIIVDYFIDEECGECGRWTQSMQTIIELCDRCFAVDWERGLTEHQENEFYKQPYEVEKVEKMIKITKWVAIDKK